MHVNLHRHFGESSHGIQVCRMETQQAAHSCYKNSRSLPFWTNRYWSVMKRKCACAVWWQAWQAPFGCMLTGWSKREESGLWGCRGQGSPGPPPRWWGEEMHSHIPSCASAAVLVVGAAGLVCCRPTIGQRGVQLEGATKRVVTPPERKRPRTFSM